MDFCCDACESTSGAKRNWGRWSDIVAVMLPDIMRNYIREYVVSKGFWVTYNSRW